MRRAMARGKQCAEVALPSHDSLQVFEFEEKTSSL